MKTIIKNATAILGQELMSVFVETYGDDEKALQEIIAEAIRALKYVREDFELEEIVSDDSTEAA